MNKKIVISILVVIIATIFIFVFTTNNNENNQIIDETPKEEANLNNDISQSIDEKVNNLMENMTIEQKIAQMLVLYYPNNSVDENLQTLLQTTPPGGFILMKGNITTYENTKEYVDDLKKYSNIPLIISIDQEGGNVQRLQYLSDIKATNIPFMYNLGQTNNTELAYEVRKSYG